MSVQALSKAICVNDISSTEKLMLIVLSNYANEDMCCWPSQRLLADQCCLNERTVRRTITSLEERGLIVREPHFRADGSQTSDRIYLVFGEENMSTPPGIMSAPPRAQSPTPPGTVPALTTFEPSLNHQNESSVECASASPVSDWPEGSPLPVLVAAAGPGLADPAKSPNLFTTSGVIGSWKSNGCSFADDVLPVVVGLTQAKRPAPISTWAYFTQAVVRARDLRLASLAGTGEFIHHEPFQKSAPGFYDEVEARLRRLQSERSA